MAKKRIAELQEKPQIVFIGDGVSDLSAAIEADIVFAKKGKDLETWCIRKGIICICVNKSKIVHRSDLQHGQKNFVKELKFFIPFSTLIASPIHCEYVRFFQSFDQTKPQAHPR